MLSVVFDTNVYRGTGNTKFDEIIAAEKRYGIRPLLNYLVATEPLTHLTDPDTQDFAKSIAALRRVVSHCTRDGDGRIKFLPTADEQVIDIAFGVRESKAEILDRELYRSLLGRIVSEPYEDWQADHRLAIAAIAGRVGRSEEAFAADLWRRIVKPLVPTAAEWKDVVRADRRAESLADLDSDEAVERAVTVVVERARSFLEYSPTRQEMMVAQERVRGAYGTAHRFHVALVRDLIKNGPDMTKSSRKNHVWDHQIAFSTWPGATAGGLPLWLITSDQAILDAAARAGASSNFRSFDSYKALLSDPVSLASEASITRDSTAD